MKRFVFTFLIALAGCSTMREVHSPAGVHHVVLCWLKDSGNAEQRQQIVETSKVFAGIPGVQDIHIGKALESDRPIVDDSFDVAITMSFADKKAMEAYINHPLHVKTVRENFMPILRKIVVYDFEE